MSASLYPLIRDRIRIGDVFAFGGRGFVSGGIKLLTQNPVSHVAGVYRTEGDRVLLIESTTLSGKKGVQVNFASERITDYDGDVWFCPRSDEYRARVNWERWLSFLRDYEQRAIPYDYRQCLRMAIAPLAHVPGLGFLRNHEDLSKVYCSELLAAADENADGLPFGTDASDIAPADYLAFGMYFDAIQIKGKPKNIPHFNSRNVWTASGAAC